jgi:hypothetical protein
VANRPFPKLAYKFFGPYKIIERIGDVAYKLELPSHSEIHPVFHISQLKPFTPDYTPVYSELPAITDLEATNAVPEYVLQRHLVKKGNTVVPQEFVKLSGLSPTTTCCGQGTRWRLLGVKQNLRPGEVSRSTAEGVLGEGIN